MQDFAIVPVGFVRSHVKAPMVDDAWGAVTSVIELDGKRFSADATAGLEGFSHVQVLFRFHLVSPDQVEYGARHPKGRTEWPKIGIFAQRAKRRPNLLGVSTCRLLRVDRLTLTVLDLDAIDGTPVLDIKPYMLEFGPHGEVRQPKWSRELMEKYFDPLGGQPHRPNAML